MKRLVLVLLFANLAFGGYAWFVGEPARVAPAMAPGPAVPRLRLASEVRDLPSRRCLSLGPFADQALAERAVLWLRGEGRAPELRTTVLDAGPGYWVRVEAATAEQATRIALRLRAAGVADVEVLAPAVAGADAVVSLGIYSERERAEHRAAELRAYALNPSVVERPRTASNWWIDVPRRATEAAFDLDALRKAIPEATGIGLAVCPAPFPSAAPAAPQPGPGGGDSVGNSASDSAGNPASNPADRPAGTTGRPAPPAGEAAGTSAYG